MRSPHRLPLVALCLLLPFLAGVPDASADEWGDARKAFRKAQRSPEMPIRRGAYIDMLTFDGTDRTEDAMEEVFRALTKEESPAVILTGIDTISTFTSDQATAKIVDTVKRGRGTKRLFALIALADRPAGGGEGILLEILQGKEEPLVCQAALALGRRQAQAAIPHLLQLLQHDTWQLRAAAARSLKLMGGKPVLNKATGLDELPPAPAWLKTKEILGALANSLETAEGRARGDIVGALERITDGKFGYDVRAWKQVAEGRPLGEVTAVPSRVPHIFGIPIYGRKVVVIIDISTCTDDTHPFKTLGRLKEVLSVPNARPVGLPTIRTTKEFYAAHAKRLIKDLPTRGHKFEVIAVFTKIEGVFEKLVNVNSGTKKQAVTFIEELTVQGGPNHYFALNHALDISGTKDSVAWSLGPDEVVMMTCAIPWAPKDPNAMVDQSEVGAAIGMKARLRMVPIHMVGVGPHPFEMMGLISEQSGGQYLDLSR